MDALDVKMLNQTPVDDTSHDDEIDMLIPKYLKLAEEYCNQTLTLNICLLALRNLLLNVLNIVQTAISHHVLWVRLAILL